MNAKWFGMLALVAMLASGCLGQNDEGGTTKAKDPAPALDSESLNYLNAIRNASGMASLSASDQLTQAAQDHADYLAHHNLSGHYQMEGTALFTGITPKDRVRYVQSPSLYVLENVSVGQESYQESIDGLMSAIYHRFGFLAFFADEIGFHNSDEAFVYKMGVGGLSDLCAYDSRKQESFLTGLCFDDEIRVYEGEYNELKSRVMGSQPEVVRYPYGGQQGVQTAFFQESPDPMPDRDISGYPVSVQLNPSKSGDTISMQSFKLLENCTTEVANTRILTQTSDPNNQFTDREFALFPLERLAFGARYCAKFSYNQDGEPKSLQWSFETESIANRIDIHTDDEEHTIQRGTPYHIHFIPWDVALSTAQNSYGYSATGGLEIESRLFDPYIIALEVHQ